MLAEAASASTVLVAIVNNQRDLDCALRDRWYRIPLSSAPRPLAADYLALYLTGALGAQGACVRYLAPIVAWNIRRRSELLPAEAGHPRADRLYYRLGLGLPHELERPVPSGRLRRITFIPTTLGALRSATCVRDLWQRREALACLCRELRQEGASPADRRLREERRAAALPVMLPQRWCPGCLRLVR